MKYFGYSFYVKDGRCRLGLYPKTKASIKSRLKELAGRSIGMGYEERKEEQRTYMRGMMEYYKFVDAQKFMRATDEWYRSRLRMCMWKCWKKFNTRFENLMKCVVGKWQAWQWANTRKGYWRIAGCYVLTRAISNDELKRLGYPCLMDYYKRLHV